MKILVTGGTGYIGSHTAVELQKSGIEVVIIDDLSNSSAEVVDRIGEITGTRPYFVEMDLKREKEVIDFFRNYDDLAGVIHFAASKSVPESVEKPLLYYENNLLSMLNVLKGMRESGPKDLVFSSSCTVYGQPDKLPVTEESPLKEAWSPYGHTKQICEQIIRSVSKDSSIRAILLRYFNPIGAHDSALIGELPTGIPNNLAPYITQTAIGKREFLRIFGDDYNTPDGTAIRDFIHVVDLARAHVAAIRRLAGRKNRESVEVFNLGTGRGFSVMEVVRSFERVSGVKLNYEITGRRPGDVEKIWADTSKANRALEWNAERDLDDMMRTAWNWEQALHQKENA